MVSSHVANHAVPPTRPDVSLHVCEMQVSADNFAPEDLKYKFLELPLVSQSDLKGDSLGQQNADASAALQAKFNKYQPDIAGWVLPLHVRFCGDFFFFFFLLWLQTPVILAAGSDLSRRRLIYFIPKQDKSFVAEVNALPAAQRGAFVKAKINANPEKGAFMFLHCYVFLVDRAAPDSTYVRLLYQVARVLIIHSSARAPQNPYHAVELLEMFVHEMALHLSRAALLTGNADPADFVKQLRAKDFPANLGETLAMDTLCSLSGGAERDTAKPFSAQIDAVRVDQVLKLIAPLLAAPTWPQQVARYMVEIDLTKGDKQKLQTSEYYGMFWAFFPMLVAFIVFTYWEEFQHISHARHDQHDRVHALAKQEEH